MKFGHLHHSARKYSSPALMTGKGSGSPETAQPSLYPFTEQIGVDLIRVAAVSVKSHLNLV
jgi:hypothetical protein